MVDVKELWVGDVVIMTGSGRVGKFVGISADGRARIQSSSKIYLVAGANLMLKPEADTFPHHLLDDLIEDKTKHVNKSKPNKGKIANSIDLHIEVLAPEMANLPNGVIIDYQLKACKDYIIAAIASNMPHVTIIHGKGQGVLRREVEEMMNTFSQAKFKISKNDGGALEVWLS